MNWKRRKVKYAVSETLDRMLLHFKELALAQKKKQKKNKIITPIFANNNYISVNKSQSMHPKIAKC